MQRNSATLNGGGIFRTQGSGTVNLCLFKNNTAAKLGGAIYDVQVTHQPPPPPPMGLQAASVPQTLPVMLVSRGEGEGS